MGSQAKVNTVFQTQFRWKSAAPQTFDPRPWKLGTFLLFWALVYIILQRWWSLDLGVLYDEAYTAINYAWKGWGVSLTTYDVPNNHVLNSMLVGSLLRWFGPSAWALHLFSFLSFCYVAIIGWRLCQTGTAKFLWVALLCAPVSLVHYSIEARGYMPSAAFLLLAWRQMVTHRERNLLRVGRGDYGALHWSLFWTLCGCLTLPSHIYFALIPFVANFHWRRRALLFSELSRSLVWGAATVAVYVPIVIYVLGFGVTMPGDKFQWSQSVGVLIPAAAHIVGVVARESWGLLPAAVILGLFVSGTRRSLVCVLLVPWLVTLATQTVLPFERSWVAGWILLSLLAAQGASEVLNKLRPEVLLRALLIILLGATLWQHQSSLQRVQSEFSHQGNLQAAERALTGMIRPGDFLALSVDSKDQMQFLSLAQTTSFLQWRLYPIQEDWHLGLFLVYDGSTPLAKPVPTSRVFLLRDYRPYHDLSELRDWSFVEASESTSEKSPTEIWSLANGANRRAIHLMRFQSTADH